MTLFLPNLPNWAVASPPESAHRTTRSAGSSRHPPDRLREPDLMRPSFREQVPHLGARPRGDDAQDALAHPIEHLVQDRQIVVELPLERHVLDEVILVQELA